MNGFNNLIQNDGFGEGGWSAFKQGAISGALSGAIGGGIKGYEYAKAKGANPYSNIIDGSESKYETPVKAGVPIQDTPDEYCYANASAYADAGHGNHSAKEFIELNKYAAGGDVSGLSDLSGAKLVGLGPMDKLSDDILKVGGAIVNPSIEMLATIQSDDKYHWINKYKLCFNQRISMFGGRIISLTTFGYWDPATVTTSSTSSILFFKLYKF